MDLNDFWQENKRFVLTVAGGLLAFLIGVAAINSVYGSDLAIMKRRLSKAEAGLSKAMFKPGDLSRVQDENDKLRAALGELTEAVGFRPRPEFQLGEGKATNRYFAVVSEVREDLMARAGRAGLSIPEDLGLPQLSPSKEQEIERYLEALDLVDRCVRMAIEVGVTRVEKIQIKLDSRLLAGRSIDGLERTRVEMRFKGPSESLVQLGLLTQQPREGHVLQVDRVEMLANEIKPEEARMDLTLLAAHVHGMDDLQSGDE
jgi:hypothetical protein